MSDKLDSRDHLQCAYNICALLQCRCHAFMQRIVHVVVIDSALGFCRIDIFSLLLQRVYGNCIATFAYICDVAVDKICR